MIELENNYNLTVFKLCTFVDALSSTLWHMSSQICRPHFSERPQILPQEAGFEFQQGHIDLSCPPIHSTSTFTSHFGWGNFMISWRSVWISHGPAGLKFLSTICVLTASWHLLWQRCSHPVTLFFNKHFCMQGGHSFGWQLWGFVWWHFEDILQGKRHFGGFVFFSRPHDTVVDVFPHLFIHIC